MAHMGIFGGMLVAFFLISKEILVFNEKTLVALAFIVFMFLVLTNYGESFAKGLDEKSNLLEEEYSRSKALEKAYVEKLIAFHQSQAEVSSEIAKFAESLEDSFNELLQIREEAYVAELEALVEQRLKRLYEVEQQSLVAFNNAVVNSVINGLHEQTDEDTEDNDLDQLEQILDNSVTPYSFYEIVESTDADQYEGEDAVWSASVEEEEIEYELLGNAEDLDEEVFEDPTVSVELYRENDTI